jgi:DNA-binding transcriptional LysR family regulator
MMNPSKGVGVNSFWSFLWRDESPIIETTRLIDGTAMDLHALSDFNIVVTHGGFGRASRATGRPKASLSRRVMQLEEAMGVRLLQRGSGTLMLTEEGHALHASTGRLLAEIEEAADAVGMTSRRPSGRLRISAPTFLAYETMGRLAATYVAQYPDVRIEVIAEDRFVDLIAEDYDVVIRANPAPDTALAGRCFLRGPQVVVASPRVAEAVQNDNVIPAVGILSAPDHDVWHIDATQGARTLHPRTVARFSSISMVRDAALASAGAAVLTEYLARAALQSGRLVNLGNLRDRSVEVWALYATRRQLSPKISAFVKLLTETYADADGITPPATLP